jgi:glucose-6-phosphate 1-epimerase
MSDLAALQRFAVPGSITIDAGCGGMPRVAISTPLCRGEIYLHGAQVTAWQPAGHAPVLWMSSQSWFAAGKAIRGGIPVCWPWFGPSAEPGRPAHGLARFADWQLASVHSEADGTVVVIMRLVVAAPAAEVLLTARFGRRLDVELSACNTGASAIAIGEALHTYLAVADVRRIAVRGLGRAPGEDRCAQPFAITGAEPLTVAAETDLFFAGHTGEVVVDDPILNRRIRVAKRGSASTVVWNPWIAKAARMPDFGDHEWPGMICVEAANALADGYPLAPGATHRLATVIEVM